MGDIEMQHTNDAAAYPDHRESGSRDATAGSSTIYIIHEDVLGASDEQPARQGSYERLRDL